MAVLNILTWPAPRLKEAAQPVSLFDDELQTFIHDLEETLRAGPAAIGIAATQVGSSRRVIIIDASSRKNINHHGRLVLINPEITHWEGYATGREGCLSVPDYTGNVIRAERISVEAQDEGGQTHTWHMEGFEARLVQHEIDHLDGLLFLDRLVSRRNDLYRRKNYKHRPENKT